MADRCRCGSKATGGICWRSSVSSDLCTEPTNFLVEDFPSIRATTAGPQSQNGQVHPAGPSRIEQLHASVINSVGLDDLPAPEPLIDGILYRDTLAWLHGKPGCGKSFIALDWAGCVSTGLPGQDRVVLTGPVLYVIAEGVTGLRQRVRAWEDYTGQRTMADFLPVAVQFLDALDRAALIEVARDLE